MQNSKFKIQNNFLIILGALLIGIFAVWRYHQARILSFSSSQTYNLQSTTYDLVPTHIKAYPVGVDIDISPAVIVDGVWPVFRSSAGYVINGNNLVIYGHNKDNIMGPIRHIKVGAEIIITDKDDKDLIFEVQKIDEVDPDNLNYIQKTNEEILTVYTCSGFLDSKRFIAVAKRIN